MSTERPGDGEHGLERRRARWDRGVAGAAYSLALLAAAVGWIWALVGGGFDRLPIAVTVPFLIASVVLLLVVLLEAAERILARLRR